MKDLSEKVVLITGASSGIGEALAVELARARCQLMLVARREEVLRGLADRIRADAADVEVFVADVGKADQCAAAVDRTIAKWGRVDVAILSAGLGIYRRIHEFDAVEAGGMIHTNVNGIIYCVGALLPVMIKQQSGMIVGLSSLAAHFVSPVSSAYAASKAAVSTFLEGVRRGVGKHGIHVLTVEPGYIRTPMTAKNKHLPFIIKADEAARRIVRGIRREKQVLRFPWIMMMSIRLSALMPKNFMRWVVQRKAGGVVMREDKS